MLTILTSDCGRCKIIFLHHLKLRNIREWRIISLFWLFPTFPLEDISRNFLNLIYGSLYFDVIAKFTYNLAYIACSQFWAVITFHILQFFANCGQTNLYKIVCILDDHTTRFFQDYLDFWRTIPLLFHNHILQFFVNCGQTNLHKIVCI